MLISSFVESKAHPHQPKCFFASQSASHSPPPPTAHSPHERQPAMKTFASTRDPVQGINYKRGALIAGGLAIAAYYIAERRNHRMPPNENITEKTLRPETGTTMQVGTNREQQQMRTPPPSKMTSQTDKGRQ